MSSVGGAAAVSVWFGVTAVSAAPIVVPNGGFSEPVIPHDGSLDDEDPLDTDPGGPTGWTFVMEQSPPATLSWGVARPDPDAHYDRVNTDPLPFPFDGDQIGFMNLNNDPTSPTGASIGRADTGVLGTIQAGTYTLNVGVGARTTGSWRNIDYSIGLVSGATELGTFTHQIMDPGNAAGNAPSTPGATNDINIADVTYVLVVPEGDLLIGQDVFARIRFANTGLNGTGTFTQANFDNVRLDFVAVPEPGSLALLALGAAGLLSRRRGHA